jgi:hypothetical protein
VRDSGVIVRKGRKIDWAWSDYSAVTVLYFSVPMLLLLTVPCLYRFVLVAFDMPW